MTVPPDPNEQPLLTPGPVAFPLVPDHELVRLIGSGSSGQVWLARNAIGTYRAVKIVYRKQFRTTPLRTRVQRHPEIRAGLAHHDGHVNILHVGRNTRPAIFIYIMELADDANGGPAIDPERYVPKTLKSECSDAAGCRPRNASNSASR